MGAMQNNPKATGRNKKKRGSVRNEHRLQAFASGGEVGKAEWGSCSPERLHGVVHAITALGGAITFGLSRDMGAHSITLMLDQDRRTLWFNGDSNLDEEMEAVLATLSQMG